MHTVLRCESKAVGALPASSSTLCQDDDHVIMIKLSIYVPSFIYNCKGFHKLHYQVLPRGEAEPRCHPAPTPVTFHVPDHLPPHRAAPNPSPRYKGSQRYLPPTVLSHCAGLCSQHLSGSSKINLCYSLYAHVSCGENEALGRLGKLLRVARPVRGRTGIQTQVCARVCVRACVHILSHVQLFATPWTVAHWASLSVEFPWQRILEWWTFLVIQWLRFRRPVFDPWPKNLIPCGATKSLHAAHKGPTCCN